MPPPDWNFIERYEELYSMNRAMAITDYNYDRTINTHRLFSALSRVNPTKKSTMCRKYPSTMAYLARLFLDYQL